MMRGTYGDREVTIREYTGNGTSQLSVSYVKDPGFGPTTMYNIGLTASLRIESGDDAAELRRVADSAERGARFIGHEGSRAWYVSEVARLRELADIADECAFWAAHYEAEGAVS